MRETETNFYCPTSQHATQISNIIRDKVIGATAEYGGKFCDKETEVMLTLDKMAEVMTTDESSAETGFQAKMAMSASARELPSWLVNGEYRAGSGPSDNYGGSAANDLGFASGNVSAMATRGLAFSASAAAFPGARTTPLHKKMLPSVRICVELLEEC